MYQRMGFRVAIISCGLSLLLFGAWLIRIGIVRTPDRFYYDAPSGTFYGVIDNGSGSWSFFTSSLSGTSIFVGKGVAVLAGLLVSLAGFALCSEQTVGLFHPRTSTILQTKKPHRQLPKVVYIKTKSS